MLTGDNEGTAKMIASEANVNRFFAELLPEDKVDAIKNYKMKVIRWQWLETVLMMRQHLQQQI